MGFAPENLHVSLHNNNTCIMTTKLTLTLDDAVIHSAKKYAKSKGKSLSHLIENYLKALVDESEEDFHIPASILKWKGVIQLPNDFNYKKEISKILADKHKKNK